MGKKKILKKVQKAAKEGGKAKMAMTAAKFVGVAAGVGLAAYGIEKGAEYLGVRGGAGFIGKKPKKENGHKKSVKMKLKEAYSKRALRKLRVGNLGGARKDLYKKATIV